MRRAGVRRGHLRGASATAGSPPPAPGSPDEASGLRGGGALGAAEERTKESPAPSGAGLLRPISTAAADNTLGLATRKPIGSGDRELVRPHVGRFAGGSGWGAWGAGAPGGPDSYPRPTPLWDPRAVRSCPRGFVRVLWARSAVPPLCSAVLRAGAVAVPIAHAEVK